MQRRQRLPLPTYPFQRQTYFIAPGRSGSSVAEQRQEPARTDDLAAWGWRPYWRARAVEAEADRPEDLPACTWLVFADRVGLADPAVARLRAGGHRVIEVRAGDAFLRSGEDAYVIAPERGRGDYDRLVRELSSRGLAPVRIAHFWLVTEGEEFRPGSSFFHRNQEQGFWSLLFLAQAIAEENLPRPIHLTMVTTGAQQVRDEALPEPEKATAAGPLRVMPREFPGLTCASLDVVLPGGRGHARRAALSALADRVIEDLIADPGNRVAALRGERRFELGWRSQTLPEPVPPLPPGSVWMLTGGFGGIGMTVAERLARQGDARLVLFARRPLPDRSRWPLLLRQSAPGDPIAERIRAVERLEALGAEVMVLAGDVCNVEEVEAARDAALARFGRIDGLIHAAGVVDDAPILAKDPGVVEEVFAPKIHGTRVLWQALSGAGLRRMVLFSSTSTAIAPAGQVDYVAANEFLNAFARSHDGHGVKVTAVNWGIWADTGMAAEALGARSWPAAPVEPVARPLLDSASFDARGNRLFAARWTTARWVLDEHRTRDGTALLPGTGYLELAAEALAAHGEAAAFEVEELYFFRPLTVADGTTRDIRVRLTRDEGGYGFEVQGALAIDGRIGWETTAQGRLRFGLAPPDRLDLRQIRTRCTAARHADPAGLRSAQEDHLRFGPRWRVLRRMALGDGEGVAELALDPGIAGADSDFLLHPALLDIATGWAMALIPGWTAAHLWVPVSYGRVRVHRRLPDRVTSWVRGHPDNAADAPFARFDIVLADADGEVCLEAAAFTVRRMEVGLDLTAPADPRAVQFDAPEAGTRPAGPAEDRLRHNLSQGIRASEGAEALDRALATGLAQVVVSSMPLPALIAQADGAVLAEPAASQSFERPDLDSAYLAPRTDIERTLVGFWQDLLGVAQVGVEDSFFDLGGHSLIAVRLFARIRRHYAVDLPISVLFEAPTIAACARLIEERIGPKAGTDGAAPAAPVRRFAHLVAMHQGEGGPRTPFFLVAGMFGNVMNLRHLAQLLGGDRPFYGLQARGLLGDAEPHRSFPEAAADYIAEMRQVHSGGPWLLGGFSGGGITAWEMAQQLSAAGERVAALVLLDTPLPVRPGLSPTDKALVKLAEFRRKGPVYLAEWLRARRDWHRLQQELRNRPPEVEGSFHDTEIEAAFRAALPGYALRAWTGRVVLFRPPLDRHWQVTGGRWINRAKEFVLPDNGWTPFAPSLEVIEVPGDHDSMVLEPNVRVLARRLRTVIAAAEAEVQPVARAAE
ncbi:MAG: SDR family NAD(P)-dependent oxidoreductase [Gemmobacter sp.]